MDVSSIAPAMTSSLGAVLTVDSDDDVDRLLDDVVVSDVVVDVVRPLCQSSIHFAAASVLAVVASSLAFAAATVSFAASSRLLPLISERSPHPADDPASSEWDPKNERPESVGAADDPSATTELGGATAPVRADGWGPVDLMGAPLESVVANVVAVCTASTTYPEPIWGS